MRIFPVNLVNCYTYVNSCANRQASIFMKNNAVDSVSFSRRIKTPANGSKKYSLETREAKSCYDRTGELDRKTAGVLSELDTKTNEFINIANDKISSSEKYRGIIQKELDKHTRSNSTVVYKNKDGSKSIVLNGEDNTIYATAHKNGIITEIKVYDDYNDHGEENKREVYTFDNATGKLGKYLYNSNESNPVEFSIHYSDRQLEGKRINKQSWGEEEETFHVGYNEKDEIHTSKYEEKTMVGNSVLKTTLQKTSISSYKEDKYALFKKVTDKNNRIELKNYFRCIRYN